MTLPWKKGPPPEGEAGTWLVWSEAGGERIAFRPTWGDRRLEIYDSKPGDEPASGWEASITHHYPEKITPPGEASAPPSPREGGEGRELERLIRQWRGRAKLLDRVAQSKATEHLLPQRERASLKASVLRRVADELEALG